MFKRRKNSFIYTLVLAFAFLLLTFNLSSVAITTTEAKHYTELRLPPLPDVKLPKYDRMTLKNGMVVYLMEDHELPLVNGRAVIRTGDRLEPGDKIGLGELVGTVMRTGGTSKRTPDQLNETLEQLAASVETSVSESMGTASFQTLSEDLGTVFGLYTEVLREPVFAADKLELAKTQEGGKIARRNDDPDDIAQREFKKVIYGNTSPYARTTEYSTLAKITRDDLVKFYQQYFYPNNMILGIVGDFDSQKMKSLIQAKFGDWKPSATPIKPELPKVTQKESTNGVYFVNQPQLTQSNILIGHLGGQYNSPDYAALDVLNGVLNGFGGRLFNEVRSRQGLAYSVYGSWNPKYDYPGMFIAGGQTRSDATVQFIKAIQTEIKQLQAEPVTAKELAFAKDSTLNSFVFNFEDPFQVLSRLMRYEYYGYPADFLFTYRKQVEATTAADVQKVAQKYLKPDSFITLVVGNQKAINPPLSQLANQVTAIDVTIPAPPQS
jgi:zinc protease